MASEKEWDKATYRFRTLIASMAPNTPTTPSYFPEYGIASIWEPVETGASSGSEPTLCRSQNWEIILVLLRESQHNWTGNWEQEDQNELKTHHRPNMFPTASSLTDRPEMFIKFLTNLHINVAS